MKHYNIPIFIPELACPNRCVFCNQSKISGQISIPSDEEILNIIESHLRTFKKPYKAEIAFFGGNFTGIELDTQESLLNLVQPYIKDEIEGIRISTRPDYINKETLDMLKAYNVTSIEIGAQSLSQEVLEHSQRGHSVEDVEKASQLILEYGFELGLQMMIGLPKDSLERAKHTAERIIELGAHSTRIYPCLVVQDTELETMFSSEKYIPLSLEEAVEWSAIIYERLYNNNVKILKVGLHPTKDFTNKKSLIAGPFHPSFRELVLSQIWKKKLLEMPSSINRKIIVHIPPKSINHIIGYGSSNRELLEKRFSSVEFHELKGLRGFEYRYEILD